MKKNIFIMMLALILVVGMGNFAFARHYHPGHGVKHGYYKVKKHKHHRIYKRFHRHVWHHHQPVVVVKERYIPYPEPSSSGGTELEFGNIVLRLPEVVVFD